MVKGSFKNLVLMKAKIAERTIKMEMILKMLMAVFLGLVLGAKYNHFRNAGRKSRNQSKR